MQYSPKLKKAAEQIKKILKDNDIAAQIVLADGNGFSEFVNHINTTWSCAFFEGDYLRVRAKLKDFAGDKEAWTKKVGDTVNMLTHIRDNSGRNFMGYDSILEALKKDMEIDESPGDITGHIQQNN